MSRTLGDKNWTPDEEATLRLLVGRKMSLENVGKTLGRTKTAVRHRLNKHMADFWKDSDHPEKARETAPRLVRSNNATRAIGTMCDKIDAVDKKVDRVIAMMMALLSALGEAEDKAPPPNGRDPDMAVEVVPDE